ncbi:galactokinase [Tribonema minus]|uniref:Galactokinase n=1 Tax=Tribonema minus TaxID=303371 RepID=A0A836CBL4_9STRA|nr:galactokinase [Tribonema minus]
MLHVLAAAVFLGSNLLSCCFYCLCEGFVIPFSTSSKLPLDSSKAVVADRTRTREELLQAARDGFRAAFGAPPDPQHEYAAWAPGRVNLIGEHTDYNGGFVLPCALERGTVVLAAGRLVRADAADAGRVRVASMDCRGGDGMLTFAALPEELGPGEESWGNYVRGAIAQYLGDVPEGRALALDMFIVGSLPLGGGLSSSASLTTAVATLVEAVLEGEGWQAPEDARVKARRCRRAEHDFLGTPCGIMDQFASALCPPGHAILLDCASETFEPVPLDDGAVTLVITDSRVTHSLGQRGSQYPVRVAQCAAAARAVGADSLRSAELPALEQEAKRGGMSEVELARARHVVTENERCVNFADALRKRDYDAAGAAMLESHASLRDNYEVSAPELDKLVELAAATDGVYGSRLTGAGFGGCTVTLAQTDAVPALVRRLRRGYKEAFGLDCACFATRAGGGARVLLRPRP